jgi:ABC-2 type transport system permease protein
MRVLYILWLRQIIKYFRSKPRIIGSLGQPLLFLLSFGYGFGSIYARAGEGNFLQFLAPGIITMSVVFTAVFSGISMIWDKQFGFLKETLAAPVSRFTIVLGRTLGGATVASFQGIIVFLLTLVFGFKPANWYVFPLAFIFIFLISLLFTALGTAIASVLDDMQGFQLIMNFLIMPIFFLSGALFPLEGLPNFMKSVINLNPLSYGVDAVRSILISSPSSFGITTDLFVVLGASLVLLSIGSYLFSKIQV